MQGLTVPDPPLIATGNLPVKDIPLALSLCNQWFSRNQTISLVKQDFDRTVCAISFVSKKLQIFIYIIVEFVQSHAQQAFLVDQTPDVLVGDKTPVSAPVTVSRTSWRKRKEAEEDKVTKNPNKKGKQYRCRVYAINPCNLLDIHSSTARRIAPMLLDRFLRMNGWLRKR